MRLLILSPELWPIYGGVGNYVVQVVKNMPRDVEIEIATMSSSTTPSEEADSLTKLGTVLPSNVRITYLGKRRSTGLRRIAFPWECRDYLKTIVANKRFDIVHAASTLPDFLVSPKRLGIPLVSTIHTTVEGHWQSLKSLRGGFGELNRSEKWVLMFGPALSWVENSYYTNSRHYITVSEWAKRKIIEEKRIDPDRIRVIQIGVDSDNFTPAKRERARQIYPDLSAIDKPKVLYLSRMATRKGIGLLIKAIPKILQKVDVHFVFAGAGERPEFNIPKQDYTYLGLVPHDHPPYLYSMSDIFILPSLYENFPACILEAMASECAAVSTRICGIPEMIKHDENGLMIPPNDVDEISRAIIRLAEDDGLRRKMGKRAREDVVKTFSWERASANTMKYYEEVVSRDGRQGRS